jgi:two-component system sensor histidine kinase CreC
MKHFKLNIGTKLFILYFVISSALVWLFVHRTSIESAKEVMIEVSALMSRIASENTINGEIDIVTFENLIGSYFRSQSNTIHHANSQRLENLAIYLTDKDGLLILDSRDLKIGKNMRHLSEVESALQGGRGITRVVAEPVLGPRKARGVAIDYFYKPEFLHASNPIYGKNGEILGAIVVVAPMFDLMNKDYLFEFIFYVFLISLIFGALGSYRISRNIKRLDKYISSLFSGEDVTPPDLNVQFNKLALTIQNARSNVELKDAVEQYIDTLAHELRTPITGIQLTAETLLTPMSDKERKRFIKNILVSNKQMDKLVTRLLDLSRIERRESLMKPQKLKILPIIENAIKAPTRTRTIASKNINIALEIDKKSTIFAEKILLEQAISNILNNALEFSPKEGIITIKASETNTAVSIIMLDDGPGLPPHVLRNLFTRFFSVSRPDSGDRGNGLGLRFVRKIMQLHGGEVTLKNRLLQQGAEAKLRFPIK